MEPIELKARREGLGLNQEEMAAILGVKQTTLSRWESGHSAPRDPVEVEMMAGNVEDLHDRIIDELCELGEHSSAVRDSAGVVLRTYRTNEAYWEADAQAREMRIPAALHRSAAAWARRILESEDGIEARIVEWRA